MLTVAMLLSSQLLNAAVLNGTIVDKISGEPLIGAAVIVKGSMMGTATDVDGSFSLDLPEGNTTLTISYISYEESEIILNIEDGMQPLLIQLSQDSQNLDEVVVSARVSLESEGTLRQERIASNVAIENMGAKEMSIKGLSNVQEGVKKMTGVSVASAGQLVVRGLGDRYSVTTLNGQPIASPNPDNKLIPLNIFPSSAVQNITVSKVYNAEAYADYSGAHIDISTKELVGENFFSFGFSVGGNLGTVGNDFLRMDNASLFTKSTVDPVALNANTNIGSAAYSIYGEDYARDNEIFETTFNVEKSTALPTFSGDLSVGHTFEVKNQELNIIAAFGVGNDQSTNYDSEARIYSYTGYITDEYIYDSYQTELKIAGLFNASVSLRDNDRLSFTSFYARNASETYSLRKGTDIDVSDEITISNSTTHIYSLWTNQLHGKHEISRSWDVDWGLSYTMTESDEPDRRQTMFLQSGDDLVLYTNDSQNTMRFFGELKENDINADLALNYAFMDESKVKFGAAYRLKERDYTAARFYYDMRTNATNSSARFDESIIYDVNKYFTSDAYSDGAYSFIRDISDRYKYTSSSEIFSLFASTDLHFSQAWLLNLGLRYENGYQAVHYNDGANTSELISSDLFPALNLRYAINKGNQLRFAASRTITRPSFIEMSPFLYQESYGSATVVGNEDIENSYNYNVDLRYEKISNSGDMISVTGYYKLLDNPIERVQSVSGGGQIHTFENAEAGAAYGVEVEIGKRIIDNLNVSANATYMYTNVLLSDGGSYTNKDRALQGASPYLVNADITYTPQFGEDRLTLALLYNLQGPRIHAVGILECEDIIQQDVHSLDFTASYLFSGVYQVKLSASNLLNLDDIYTQEINGVDEVVERHKYGVGLSLGFSMKF